MEKSKDGVSEPFQRAGLSNEKGKPPFADLQILIEAAGYEVISIGAEVEQRRFSGTINMQIAPKEWLKETDFTDFPQIPQGLISSLREYNTRLPSNAESGRTLSMDGVSESFKV